MAAIKTWWGNHNGQNVYLFTFTNKEMEFSVTNFGCSIVSVVKRDQQGRRRNMVLGYDSLQGYLDDPYYMGSIVGRFANRISNANFKLGEKEYMLAANETATGNHLHGGNLGFNKKVFSTDDSTFNNHQNSMEFYYRSPDGEEGYPGNLEILITYTLTEENEVVIDYRASTDQTTPVNLTSHCYFNLSGSLKPATDHDLFIRADKALAAGSDDIPTGKIEAVAGTDLDFNIARAIRNEPVFAGYNVCFQLNHPGSEAETRAVLTDFKTGTSMIVKTTLPGIMLYTGDYLDGPFEKNQGVCLEAQFFPDSPNQPHFPSTLLHPGKIYQHKTIYQFK